VRIEGDGDGKQRADDLADAAQDLSLAVLAEVSDHRAVQHKKNAIPWTAQRCHQRGHEMFKRLNA